MTYLELVNSVLKRLRESTVGSINETVYSTLVGEFVNDAKRVVEDAWPWRSLIDTVSVPLTSGVQSYDIEDYPCDNLGVAPRDRARLFIDPETGSPLVRITTDNEEAYIVKVSQSYQFIERKQAQNDSSYAKPESVIVTVNPSPLDGKSDIRLQMVPIPDNSYSLQLYLVNPQNALTNATDRLQVPYQPVLQLAYLYCLYERGEEVGEMLSLTAEKAKDALADAIMHDSSLTSELVFRAE